jgi:hypothetical protein
MLEKSFSAPSRVLLECGMAEKVKRAETVIACPVQVRLEPSFVWYGRAGSNVLFLKSKKRGGGRY